MIFSKLIWQHSFAKTFLSSGNIFLYKGKLCCVPSSAFSFKQLQAASGFRKIKKNKKNNKKKNKKQKSCKMNAKNV